MHQLTHVPFGSWCEHCVRGRGEGVRHEAGKEMPEQTEVHMDSFFVGDEDQNEKLTVLAARERTTRMTVSTVAPSKGEQQFLARRVQAFLKEIGADTGDITLKAVLSEGVEASCSGGRRPNRHRAQRSGGQQGQRGRRESCEVHRGADQSGEVSAGNEDWREDRAGACCDDMVDRVRFIVAQQV